jgi:hypothetical protein
MGTLREYQYTFIIILREFFLEWRVSDKSCSEIQNTFYVQ